ncbi:MAG TPA: efflux RND transporter permease subunit, partial [Campylobacteraceae bacterium]|nr:efflux RND transporter permease subunit [Campylobacteraceae bacterium]
PGVTAVQYKEEAQKRLAGLKLPDGYYYEWAGQSRYLQSAMEKLRIIIPLTLVILFVLIYLAFGNLLYTSMIFFTLPLALAGGVYYLAWLHLNFSIAVVVGFIALLGVAAETSIVMVVYLDEALRERKAGESFKDVVINGAALRLRPKLMTVFAILGGLVPILYIKGVGSEVMQAIAIPMIGGMVSSAALTLLVIPALFYAIKKKREVKR